MAISALAKRAPTQKRIPAPKRDVAVRLTVQIQPTRMLKHGRIAVDGETGEQHLAPPDGPTAEVGVLTRVVPLADLGERHVAEQLLGC